jgi:PAS domain S-box-containing protein
MENKPGDKELEQRVKEQEKRLQTMNQKIEDRAGELAEINRKLRLERKARKAAEEELRLQNLIFDNMAEGIYMVRTDDGEIVFANQRFESMFGYASGELIGKHVSVVNAPTEKSPEETAGEIIESLTQRGFWSGDVYNIKKDGTLFWNHANVSEFNHTRFGKVWISVHENITQSKLAQQELERIREALEKSHTGLERQVEERTAELVKTNKELLKEINVRKKVEDARRESETRYRALFDLAGIGLGVTALDGRVLDGNITIQKMIGYTLEELEHINIAELYQSPEDRSQVIEQFNRKGFVEDFDTRLIHKDGALVDVSLSLNPIQLDGKDALLAVISDITERKRINERMSLLSTVVEQTTEGIAVADISGNLIYSNNTFANMHGYEPGELIGENLTVLHSPGHLKSVEAANRQLKAEGRFQGEIWHMRRDGTVFPARMANSLLKDDSGNPIGLLGTMHDITEIKRAEDELRESEERFEAFFMSSPVGLVILDEEFRYEKINEVLARQNNLSVEEHIGRSIYDIVDADLADAIILSNRPALQKNEPLSYEVEGEVPGESGKRFWLVTAFPLRWRAKQGVGNVVVDTTDLKRREEEVKKRNRDLETLYAIEQIVNQKFNTQDILDSALEEIMKTFQADCGRFYLFEEDTGDLIVKSHKGLSNAFIEAAGTITMDKRSGAAVKTASSTIAQVDHYPYSDLTEIVAAEGIKTSLIIPLVLKDRIYGTINIGNKTVKHFSEEEKRLADTIGTTISMSIENIRFYEDIQQTAQKLEERVKARTHELETAKDELSESLKELDAAVKKSEYKAAELESFTYSVSHDLKAPLRGMDGYSRLLEEDHADRLNDEGRSFLKTIRRSAEQMNRLIDDLLRFSRIDQGEIDCHEVDVAGMIENILKEKQEDLACFKIDVNPDLQSVVAEPEGLLHALSNLLENAIKFSRNEPAPKIIISTHATKEEWIFQIEDNGIGFDMKYHDRIFKIFQRLERSEAFPGTGVGLAIVKKVAERMGGRVWAESKKGNGATFYLAIPIRPNSKG